MPELPELEGIIHFLNQTILDTEIVRARLLRPLVVRMLAPEQDVEDFLQGKRICSISRRGKLLLFELSSGWMAINLMLTGELWYCLPSKRLRKRDHLRLLLSNNHELRYYDSRTMGKIYLTFDLTAIPGFTTIGPDALSPTLSESAFLERLGHFRGEIKGVLTRGRLASGIGNAYADEILFEAGIYPFRKCSSLSHAERVALYQAMRRVLEQAVIMVKERMGNQIHQKFRDSLRVHNRKGLPCPRCGHPISEIRVARRSTNFCRHCQPGTFWS